jgi:integrase/recombinase XerD
MNINEKLSGFEVYLKACGFSESTRQSYTRTMRKFCDYLQLANVPVELREIRKEHIIGFLACCQESGEKSNTAAVRALTLIKFFRQLKEEGAIAADPTERIPIPKETQRVPRYVCPAQIDALLNEPDITTPWGLRDRALLEVIYSAGLRISEALDLELEDINTEEGFIYVRYGKGGKSRCVPMGATAAQWLCRYIAEARPGLLSTNCSALVFVSRDRQRLSRQSVSKALAHYVKSAGLPAWFSSHGLRHSAATHMLQGGAGLAYIQEMLGHARPESTRIYTLVRSEALKSVHAATHPRG